MDWLLIALGVMTVGMSAIFAVAFFRFRRWHPTVGRVVANIEDESGDRSRVWRPVFKLVDEFGATHFATANYAKAPPHEIGDAVPLRYNPNNSSQISTGQVWVFAAAAVACLITAAVLILIGIRMD
ncbi:DUF3592 domain-containing protein [Gulosibacter hominis]|uniref:DUF3592 domain-containing protein n=1 Tax=Gulosibacter hominis TaxID=2770504 RepID=UPI00191A95AE|nr:DUF3592 domain-containing protein [Gulosibacter hominis]